MKRRQINELLKLVMPKDWTPPVGDGRAQFQGSKAKRRALARLARIKPIPERKL